MARLGPSIALLLVGMTLVSSIGSAPGAGVTWAPTDAPLSSPTAPGATPKTEVTVAIDPTDPMHVIAANIAFGNPGGAPCCARGTWRVQTYVSEDGGASWQGGALVPVVGRDGQPMQCDDPVSADPWVVFDANGVAYVSWLSFDGGIPTAATPCPDATLAVAISHDHGLTWGAPAVVDAMRPDGTCFPDRDALAADPAGTRVFITWLGCDEQLWISHSDAPGASWSAPEMLSAPGDVQPYGSTPRVAPNGDIWVGYYRAAAFDGCLDFLTITSGTLSSAEAVVAISQDQGATWTRHVAGPVCDGEDQTLQPILVGQGDFSWPSLAIDPSTGLAAIAWMQRDAPFNTIHVTSSSDGGASWSAPIALTEAGRTSLMPSLAADHGAIHLDYVAMESGGSFHVDHQATTDGLAWSAPETIPTGESCNCFGSVNGPYADGGSIGHYIGLDARAGHVVAAWPDDRDLSGEQTIVARGGTLN